VDGVFGGEVAVGRAQHFEDHRGRVALR
jgi:hypothetical protein